MSSAAAVETEIPRTQKAIAVDTSAANKLPRTWRAAAAQATIEPEPSKARRAMASKASDAAPCKGRKVTVSKERTRVVLSSDLSDEDSDAQELPIKGDKVTAPKGGA